MPALAHAGHAHIPPWPAWAIAALAAAGTIAAITTLWLLFGELARSRVLRTIRKPAKVQAVRDAAEARRRVWAGAMAVVVVLALAGYVGRPDPVFVPKEAAGRPAAAVDDPGGRYPLTFDDAQTSGTFSATVANRTKWLVYLECQIAPRNEAGDLVTTHGYDAIAPDGEEIRSRLYTNHNLVEPHDRQIFGADVRVAGTVARWEGSCVPRPVTAEIRSKLTPAGLELLAPASR